jgi:hypothetical protein
MLLFLGICAALPGGANCLYAAGGMRLQTSGSVVGRKTMLLSYVLPCGPAR